MQLPEEEPSPHDTLITWATSTQNVTINGIHPTTMPGKGLGMITKRDIKVCFLHFITSLTNPPGLRYTDRRHTHPSPSLRTPNSAPGPTPINTKHSLRPRPPRLSTRLSYPLTQECRES